jgi:Mn2+/Fe2+ NRAMP family transporter
MLADTDAGSIITAAQSGAEWGYRLLPLQFLLMPILYIVQELTVRLDPVTGKGHAELIEDNFGSGWAWFSVSIVVLSCIGALLTELSGLAAVGALMSIPTSLVMTLVAAALLTMVFTHSYLTVERISIAVGAFELVFLLVAWLDQPSGAEIAAAVTSMPISDSKYLYLVAANIGTTVMPWMIFFQQSSIVEKKLTALDLRAARIDTCCGAILTQLIMAAALIAVAATIGGGGSAGTLDTVQQIAEAITPILGRIGGKLLFALGMSGAAMVATIVVTLTAARTIGEALGVHHRLEHEPREAPWFYGAYTVILFFGALTVMSGVNLVALSVGVQVMNAFMLPVVLGFLFSLARRLPDPFRLKGLYAIVSGSIVAATAAVGVYCGVTGLIG